MESAKIAAEWWANSMLDPKMDNGDDSLPTQTVFSLMKRRMKPVSQDQIDVFKKKLHDLVENTLLKGKGFISLSVDYHPYEPLVECLIEAGINENRLPIKTSMTVENGFVKVKHGAGGKDTILLESLDYWETELGKALRLLSQRQARLESSDNVKDIEFWEEYAKLSADRISECESAIERLRSGKDFFDIAKVQGDGYELAIVVAKGFDGSIGQKAVVVKRIGDKEENLFERLCDGYRSKYSSLTDVPFEWTEELRILSSRVSIQNKLPIYTFTPTTDGEADEITLLFKSTLSKGDSKSE